MTTTITKTIGNDGLSNYPSFDAWAADTSAFPTNLVAADVAVVGLQTTTLSGNGTLLTLDGHTTDATRNITVKPAPGKGFRDNPNRFQTALNYDETAGVGLRSSVPYVWGNGVGIVIGDNNVTLEGLQVYCTNGAPVLNWAPWRFPGPYNLLLMDSIFRSDGGPHSVNLQNATAENCLFLLNNSGQEIVLVGGNSFFYNCTSAAASDAPSLNCWGSDFSNIYIENCGMFGARNLTAGSSPSHWTWVNCMSDTLNSAKQSSKLHWHPHPSSVCWSICKQYVCCR
jgi:hypothetical protein